MGHQITLARSWQVRRHLVQTSRSAVSSQRHQPDSSGALGADAGGDHGRAVPPSSLSSARDPFLRHDFCGHRFRQRRTDRRGRGARVDPRRPRASSALIRGPRCTKAIGTPYGVPTNKTPCEDLWVDNPRRRKPTPRGGGPGFVELPGGRQMHGTSPPRHCPALSTPSWARCDTGNAHGRSIAYRRRRLVQSSRSAVLAPLRLRGSPR